MTDEKIQHLLAMCELHRLLDILGAPASDYPVKRLREYLHQQGHFIEPPSEVVIEVRCDCGWVHYVNQHCPNPVHGN